MTPPGGGHSGSGEDPPTLAIRPEGLDASPSSSWAGAALGLLALVLAFFSPALLSGAVLAPGDGLAYYFPLHAILATALRQGELPFWNPYDFGGMQLMAAIQGGVFFPGNLPFLFLDPAPAMNATVVGAYWLAGCGSLALGRALGMGVGAALLSALAFMLGGYMVAHCEHLTMIQTAGMLPAMLWAIERFRRSLASRHAIAFALLLALQVLAGHPQNVTFGLLLCGAYAGFRAVGLGRRQGAFFMLRLGAALLLGMGLCMAQLLPMADLLAASVRKTMTYASLVEDALPPRQFATLVAPYLFGGVPSAWFPTPYWGGGTWNNEVTGYVGLPTLALAGASLLAWRRSAQVRFWALVAVLALLLASGDATPLYRAWAQIPVLKIMRVPGRHLLELDLALALLAGFGLTHLQGAAASARRRMAWLGWGAVGLALMGVLGVVGALGGRMAAHWQPFMPAGVDLAFALSLARPACWVPALVWLATGLALLALARRPGFWASGLLLLVLAGDLFAFGVNQGWRQLSPAPPPGIGRALERPLPDARTFVVQAGAYPYRDFALVEALHAPAYGVLQGERPVGGYDPFLSARYASLLGGISNGGFDAGRAIWEPRHHALDLLGARTVRVATSLLRGPGAAPWRSHLEEPRWERLASGPVVTSYRNRRALPRAWRVGRVEVLGAAAVDAHVTSDPAFAPLELALIEEPLALGGLEEAGGRMDSPLRASRRPGVPAASAPGVPARAPASHVGSARATMLSLNRIRVDTRGDGPGLVLVSEGYDPGWRAFAGGRELKVHRADGLLLGVEAPAGPLSVELRFEPRRWRRGLLLSALSALALLAWAVWARWSVPGGGRAATPGLP